MKTKRSLLLILVSVLLLLSLCLSACSGTVGEKGEKGDPGEQGESGQDGKTPQLRINEQTGMWEISYNNGGNWTSLGVRATGTNGKDGTNGTQITIGENGNWFLDGVDTGMKADATQESKEFIPVLRFAVTSDLHLRSYEVEKNDYNSHEMLANLYSTAYAYSESQPYNQLDAIFFAGDFTQSGYDDEFSDFFTYVNANTKEGTVARAVLGNHEFYATKYDDGTTSDIRYSDTSVAATFKKYMDYGGYDEVDAHLVIDGYHFLVLNTNRYAYDYTGSKFSPDKLAWLETELEIAAADDPTGKKPIFVFQHMPATGTVNDASQKSSDDYLEDIFSKFPQVVDFSGHTHYPITQPQSIWQGGYTAINTGSLAYLSVPISGHPSYDTAGVRAISNSGAWQASGGEEEIRNAGLYYFVEVNAEYEIRLVVYNIYSDSVQAIISIGGVGDVSKFTYTDHRKYLSAEPYFDNEAVITAEFITNDYAQLKIPQASCEDGVSNYRVELYQGSKKVSTTYRLSCSFLGFAMPSYVTAPLNSLTPSTAYTVKVIPVSTWGKEGRALTYSFFTNASNTDVAADVLSTQFNLDGTATNTITGDTLHTAGAPEVAYDETLGRNVAEFNGSSGYAFTDMYDNYSRLTDGFTLETYVYLDKLPSSGTICPVSNMETGGFGFQIKNSGKLEFLCYTGNKAYERTSATVPVGEWVHVVGTFDGSALKLYFNGQLVGTQATTNSKFTLPISGAYYLGIGCDSSPTSTEIYGGLSHMTGKLAAANLYSDALTAAEVMSLYNSY